MFTSLYDLFTETIYSLIVAFDGLYNTFFNKTLRDLIVTGVDIDFITNIVNNLEVDVLDYTMASLCLGVGLTVLIAVTLVKWVLDVVT